MLSIVVDDKEISLVVAVKSFNQFFKAPIILKENNLLPFLLRCSLFLSKHELSIFSLSI